MLEARDLWVTPPGAREPVVRGVSMRVERGEWVALAGPNGGGKTSLLLALAGLWPAARGELTLDGRPLASDPRGRDPRLAVVLQDPSSQLLQRTVADELAFTARNLGRPASEIESAVRRWACELGLEGELDRDPRTLSAGRQQLVLLGGALVAEPDVLCADEPTAHLDPPSRRRVIGAIEACTRRGMSVLWATQAPEELDAADRVVTIGARLEAASPPGTRPPATDAPPVLRVRVSPARPDAGPVVSVAAPLVFDVRPGTLALVGPNGSGKSVLLAALGGLVESVQIEREWLAPPAVSPCVALQYPELQIFEEVVADELVFAAVSRGLSREAAIERATNGLAELGFEPAPMLARRTWSLSTGEKRLIEVVGALIAPSSLVLLDEPTAGVDPERRDALGRMVERRAGEVPVVIATQDRAWSADVGAREIVLGAEHPIDAKSQPKKRLTEPC